MFELDFTRPGSPEDPQSEWNCDKGEHRQGEEVEGRVIVFELVIFATRVAFKVVLEI